MRLKEQFGNDFASTAFQKIDGEERIVGKFGNITQLDDGTYDIWIVGPNLEPLGERKITAIEKKSKAWLKLTRLNGEAYAQVRDKEIVRKIGPLLGIKRRRQLSPEAKEKLRENIKKARESKEAA